MKPMASTHHNPRSARPIFVLATALALAITTPVAQADSVSIWSPFKKAYEKAYDSVTGLFHHDSSTKPEEPTVATAPTPIDQPHKIGDLAYGDILFDYYQEQYFSAITKILVAQERGLLKKDATHAQIVLGALYVSYGMLDKGEAIFNALLKANMTPAGADEAWYQLARIYYKRGDTQHALNILTQNLQAPAASRPVEYNLLQILCDIRLGQIDQAKALLPYLSDKQNLSVFVRFNMGSAFAQLGDTEQATRYFEEVAKLDAHDEDDRTLKDQASLALGVHYLQQQKWTEARAVLEHIRLFGPAANRGLLALGWTYFDSNQQKEALTPWLALADRDLSDPAVQEALLDIPTVYEQQGALREALARYRDAYKIFGHQRQKLEQVKQNILQPDWIRHISPVNESAQDVMDALPPFKLPVNDPATRYLYLYFASDEFQQIYHDYRELQRLYMVLVHWKRQLPSFNQMIQTNVQRLNKLAPQSAKAIEQSRRFYAYASVKLDDFSARLDEITKQDDLSGTATVKQMEQKQRLDEAEATLKSLGDPDKYRDQWTKLKLLKGLLVWDLSATAIDRRWELAKDKVAIETLLNQLESSIRRVEKARAYRMARFNGFEGRIQDLDQRMTDIQAEIAQALKDKRHYLQAVALNTVTLRQEHLDRMRAKALLAIARLQDRAYMQERARVDRAQKPVLEVELKKQTEPEPAKEPTVDEENTPRNLMDVIRKIFSE